MKFNIKHDTKNQKFYAIISGKECSLKYEKVNERLYNFKVMFVPKNLRGQGIAGRIMEFALGYIRKNAVRVKTSCSFSENYISTHKEHLGLIYNRQDFVMQEA